MSRDMEKQALQSLIKDAMRMHVEARKAKKGEPKAESKKEQKDEDDEEC